MSITEPLSVYPLRKFDLLKVLAALTLIFCLCISQDALDSHFFHKGFYWSEVLLFNVKWILVGFSLALAHRIAGIPLGWFAMAAIGIAFLQVFINALTIHWLSGAFLGHQFSLSSLVMEGMSKDLTASLIASGLMFVWRRNHLKQQVKDEPSATLNTFKIKHRNQVIFLAEESVYCVTREHGLTMLYTSYGKISRTDALHTFATIFPNLIKIHRSTLVNPIHIKMCASRGNGDYDVVLTQDQTVRLSRRYRRNIFS